MARRFEVALHFAGHGFHFGNRLAEALGGLPQNAGQLQIGLLVCLLQGGGGAFALQFGGFADLLELGVDGR